MPVSPSTWQHTTGNVQADTSISCLPCRRSGTILQNVARTHFCKVTRVRLEISGAFPESRPEFNVSRRDR